MPTTAATMPALFLAHGTPMNALERNEFTDDWHRLAAGVPRPRAILCVSAHWCTRGTFVTANERPPTIHDFRGFPEELFAARYPCPGDPPLAEEIAGMITTTTVRPTTEWGLDHGAWSVLVHLFPDADIPVLQLSLDLSRPADFHYSLGNELDALRDRRVLVIGSGNIVHNIGKWMRDPEGPFDWARDFDRTIARALAAGDDETLIHYQRAPGAAEAVPTAEHYLPLLYIAGMRRDGEAVSTSSFSPDSLGHCSMRSARIG